MRRIIYKQGEAILDEGIFFGKGVFETILFLEKPIFLKEHIERLKNGMKELGLEELEEEMLLDYISLNFIKNKAVKILVTPQNIIITEREIPYIEEDYIQGSSLKLSKVRRNSTSMLCYIKSTNYIENMIEKNKAKEDGFKDVLFLNENGYLSETSCANIFIVKNDKIYTPKVSCGLLNGIIRMWVIENFPVIEKELRLDDLKNADEVFITNSLMGIMKVKKFEDIEYNNNKIIENVQLAYQEAIQK
ncbi:MAG: aminotransferase class IV [Clostridium sp.]|nr:aminotransferase class IV [Clostridium sp.]MCI7443291.1 aminotransferase class IV [Clostridium sp.]